MANYNCAMRTNYFRVTDEEKYQKLFNGLSAEDHIDDFTKVEGDTLYHGFGAYGRIDYGEDDFDEFLSQLQTILPEDEAFVCMEAGHEKLRYVVGEAIVATSKTITYYSMNNWVKEKTKELLGQDFETTLNY